MSVATPILKGRVSKVNNTGLDYQKLLGILEQEYVVKKKALAVAFGGDVAIRAGGAGDTYPVFSSNGNGNVRHDGVIRCKSKLGKEFIRRRAVGFKRNTGRINHSFVSAYREFFAGKKSGDKFTAGEFRSYLRSKNPRYVSSDSISNMYSCLSNKKIRGEIGALGKIGGTAVYVVK